MNILSIDTTAEICSISLKYAEGLLGFHEKRPREHAKILLPEIEKIFKQVDLSIADLDLIVFGRGPGSFTGVRISAGVAQGLAFSANCPVVPMSTLQSVAFSARKPEGTEIWAALDARMSEVYFARFQIDAFGIPQPLSEEQVIAPSDITDNADESCIFVGNGWTAGYPMSDSLSLLAQNNVLDIQLPDAKDSLALAEILLEQRLITPGTAVEAQPVYLRDKVTWDKKPKVGS